MPRPAKPPTSPLDGWRQQHAGASVVRRYLSLPRDLAAALNARAMAEGRPVNDVISEHLGALVSWVPRICTECDHRWTGPLACPECGGPGEPL